MLRIMRNSVNNIIVKILLGLLAMSFLFWGVGDMLRGNGDTYVAKVGNRKISKAEFLNNVRLETNRYQSLLAKKLDKDLIKKLNIDKQVLNRLIEKNLIEKKVEDLGLLVSQKTILKKISNNQMFLDENGNFSKEAFQYILSQNNISERKYIDLLKNGVKAAMLLDSFSVSIPRLNLMTDLIFNYDNQERNVDLITIKKDILPEIRQPYNAELQQFYQDNLPMFSLPQTRRITYIYFSMKDLESDLVITQEEILDEYNKNISKYSNPELRDVDQYNFDNKKEAEEAYNKLLKDINSKIKGEKVSLGEVSAASLFNKIKTPIFSMAKEGIAQPVETSLGWHVFIVKNIIKSQPKDFKEVKPKIYNDLFQKRSSDIMYDFINKIEDKIAAGDSIQSLSNSFSLKIDTIPSITREGLNTAGKKIEDIPQSSLFLDTAFKQEEGDISDVVFLEKIKKYVVIHIDRIIPKHNRVLDEVKGKAIVLWKEKEESRQLKEISMKILDEIKKSSNIREIAKKYKVALTSNQVIDRKQQNFEPKFLRNIFLTKVKDFTLPYQDLLGNYKIAKVNKVIKANKKKGSEKFQKLNSNLVSEIESDLLDQFSVFLKKQYPVKVKKDFNDNI